MTSRQIQLLKIGSTHLQLCGIDNTFPRYTIPLAHLRIDASAEAVSLVDQTTGFSIYQGGGFAYDDLMDANLGNYFYSPDVFNHFLKCLYDGTTNQFGMPSPEGLFTAVVDANTGEMSYNAMPYWTKYTGGGGPTVPGYVIYNVYAVNDPGEFPTGAQYFGGFSSQINGGFQVNAGNDYNSAYIAIQITDDNGIIPPSAPAFFFAGNRNKRDDSSFTPFSL